MANSLIDISVWLELAAVEEKSAELYSHKQDWRLSMKMFRFVEQQELVNSIVEAKTVDVYRVISLDL